MITLIILGAVTIVSLITVIVAIHSDRPVPLTLHGASPEWVSKWNRFVSAPIPMDGTQKLEFTQMEYDTIYDEIVATMGFDPLEPDPSPRTNVSIFIPIA